MSPKRRPKRKTWALLTIALMMTACKGKNTPLVELTTLAAGEECAAGGVRIDTGVDADRDGTLSADEIASSEVVCNGESPDVAAGTVMRTTSLPEGDPECPHGGTLFEVGRDDGAGDGIADDGVLQDGEVLDAVAVCNGTPAAESMVDLAPPAGPAGAYTITAHGGAGLDGDGGDGGWLEAEADSGTYTGGVRLFATGAATHEIAYPSQVATYLGERPVIIATDTTLPLDPDTGTLADGAAYLLTDTEALMRWNASLAQPESVTGLRISSGATLTLPANTASGYAAVIRVEHDVHLAGTLRAIDTDDAPASMQVYATNWIGESTGLVDLAGPSKVDESGVRGGQFRVSAYRDIEGYPSVGAVFNRATIDVSGGDGTSGGAGGYVYLDAQHAVYNAGPVLAHGGVGSGGPGGEGGDVSLDGDYGVVLNAGDVDVSGGDGVGNGGDAGTLYLYNGYIGWVINDGDVRAAGGAVTACPDSCQGGDGGLLELYGYSVGMVNTGRFTAPGGDAPLSTGGDPTASTGGAGGKFEATITSYEGGWYASYAPMGDILVSGDITIPGGAGAHGGVGGTVEIAMDASYVPDGQRIALLGYTGMDFSGGDGTESGGHAGYVELEAEYAYADGYPSDYGPSGPVLNYVPLDLSGGAGEYGGDGGWFGMYTESYYGFAAPWDVAVNAAPVSLRGGDGTLNGGAGGELYAWGYAGFTSTGPVDASGGSASATDGVAGHGGAIAWIADANTSLTDTTLRADGGTAPMGHGGHGGRIEVVGAEVTTGGVMSAVGQTSAGSRAGGDGGLIFVYSTRGATDHQATAAAGAGAGDPPGASGAVFIDLQNYGGSY